jgi:hypothetical protein
VIAELQTLLGQHAGFFSHLAVPIVAAIAQYRDGGGFWMAGWFERIESLNFSRYFKVG